MTRRLHSWASIGTAIAWAFLSGQPAQADVAMGTAIWTCQNEGSDQATARLDVTRTSDVVAGEREVLLSEIDEPFSCRFPWGEIQVEVTDYASPGNNGRCGAAEAWGLRVMAAGHVLQDIPADNPLSCHLDSFNPFLGWVEVDAARVVVCRTQRDGSTPDCDSRLADGF